MKRPRTCHICDKPIKKDEKDDYIKTKEGWLVCVHEKCKGKKEVS